jgi:hypothetical protein
MPNPRLRSAERDESVHLAHKKKSPLYFPYGGGSLSLQLFPI